jgi:heptosyltransferase-3
VTRGTHSVDAIPSQSSGFRLAEIPARVLVIVTRRIGDVLLTAPLIRSLKDAWPSAQIELLVFKGTESVLAGNPDIDRIIVVPPSGHWRFARQVWRKYDLAISTSPSDRSTLYAWLAGKTRIGVMTDDLKSAWKRALLNASVPFDNLDLHTVVQNLQLADLLGLPRRFAIPIEWSAQDEAAIAGVFPEFGRTKFAVLHLYPNFTYKMWHLEQWQALAQWLNARGLTIVLTGSGDNEEKNYVSRFAETLSPSPVNLVGQLDFSQLALLLNRAALYVGPDTATTHLAAAMGAPTVALFGPSNPVKWGPWPRGYEARSPEMQASPYTLRGTQFAGNVALVQGAGACVPCLQEGCARHVMSESVCLQMLPAAAVIDAAERILNQGS